MKTIFICFILLSLLSCEKQILLDPVDADHYWHNDRVIEASGTPVISNESMIQQKTGKLGIGYTILSSIN